MSDDPVPSALSVPDTARAIAPGLHLIATPIGAARDITLRALDLLAGCDLLVAEDTRSLRHLMELHGLRPGARDLLAYHDHNGARMRPRILDALAQRQRVLYASEAGTPLVADPGYQLVRAAVAAGHAVHAAPGPSAMLAALTVSGLPSDRFCFMGFAPSQIGARRSFLQEAAGIPATLIFYESPKRISRFLGEMCEALGAERPAALCRELTKRHEEVLRMSLAELEEAVKHRQMRGEIVLVVGRGEPPVVDAEMLDQALAAALSEMRLKEAVAHVAQALGLPRRQVYQAALEKAKSS